MTNHDSARGNHDVTRSLKAAAASCGQAPSLAEFEAGGCKLIDATAAGQPGQQHKALYLPPLPVGTLKQLRMMPKDLQ